MKTIAPSRVATYQNGTPTTLIGPPTSGAHVQHEFWRDALGGEFRCTAAGTPGTWILKKTGHPPHVRAGVLRGGEFNRPRRQ
jgi:hypothetical protein